MNSLWKVIRINFSIKIAAIILALLVWFYVALQNEYQIDIKVPLVFETENHDTFVAEAPVKEAVLTIKGKGADILKLRFWGRPTINYKLDIDRGWARVNIEKSNISLPSWSDISVVSLKCKPFLIRVDKMVERYLPVLPVIEPAIKDIIVTPESIRCSGGIETFKKIKHIRTRPVAVDTTQLPPSRKVSLELPLDISCDPTSVILYFTQNTGD